MCGINGIALASGSHRVLERSSLIKMRDVLTHRGPDAEGIFIDGAVGLGHRRLSIVDVAHGAQPLESGDCVIVYNGEVYDHAEKRAMLTDRGYTAKTRSDTETIVDLYREFGVDCVEHLRGMFAFAIWDRGRKQLFISRDRLGVKPLYYVHAEDGSFYFASEIKAFFEIGAIKPEINFEALPDQLANHGTSGEATLFRGVKRLLPGHSLIWKDGRLKIWEYWDISYEPKTEARSEREFVDEWRELFRDSVEKRLMSDVPLGMFLSGGIDSSAIAAVMSETCDSPIKTFSVAFNESEANELEYARLVSKRFATDHHEVMLSPGDFFEALPDLVWHEDEPIGFIASVPLYFVSKLAAEHVKVVLTGEGSDEMLAGYGRYKKALKLIEYGERFESMTPAFVREAVRGGVATLPARFNRTLSRTFLTREADVENLFVDNFAVFNRSEQARMFTADASERIGRFAPYAYHASLLSQTDAKDLLDQILYLDSKTYLHELLMKQDQMSMAASIESRVPFLDHKLVELTARMPREMKLRGSTTKWLLREAMKGILPAEIIDRPKMGFPVPIGNWFRGEYWHILDEYVLSGRATERGIFDADYVRSLVARHNAGENHDERLWTLVNFEIWMRTFFD